MSQTKPNTFSSYFCEKSSTFCKKSFDNKRFVEKKKDEIKGKNTFFKRIANWVIDRWDPYRLPPAPYTPQHDRVKKDY